MLTAQQSTPSSPSVPYCSFPPLYPDSYDSPSWAHTTSTCWWKLAFSLGLVQASLSPLTSILTPVAPCNCQPLPPLWTWCIPYHFGLSPGGVGTVLPRPQLCRASTSHWGHVGDFGAHNYFRESSFKWLWIPDGSPQFGGGRAASLSYEGSRDTVLEMGWRTFQACFIADPPWVSQRLSLPGEDSDGSFLFVAVIEHCMEGLEARVRQ